MSDQGVLFKIPAHREPIRRVAKPKVTWSDYRVLNQVKCHHCLDEATAGWKTGALLGVIPTARYQRRCGAERLLLCAEHARTQRAKDAAVDTEKQTVTHRRARA